MKNILAAAAILAISVTSAQATTFDFTSWPGSGWTTGELTYSVDGIDLGVSSGRCTGTCGNFDNVIDAGNISSIPGLGLAIESSSQDGSHEVDGSGYNDVAIFNFVQDVTIESVSFSLIENGDDFAFFFDVGDNGSLNLINGDLDLHPATSYLLSALGDYTGNLFGIGALGNNDDFKIRSITVSASVVPVPAALPLMGTGLAILGFMGWRRKRSQTNA